MITVNHVMSNDVVSGIFTDILAYYRDYAGASVEQIETEKPVSGLFIRHYHRPNLEEKLISPSVVTVHHDLEDDDGSLQVERFTDRYREASRVICLNTLQQRYLERIGIRNTVVIPHGYNSKYIFTAPHDPSPEAVGARRGRIRLGILSRRYARKVKGEAYIYELAQNLDPAHFEFLLVGQGRSYDAAQLERFGFEVMVHDRLPYKTVAACYRSLDFLLMASWFEGGPASIPEAVGSGVPVLCNPVGMAHDLIEDGVNGLHLSMDPLSDAERISQWALDQEKYRALRAGAMKLRGNAITWKEHVEKVVDVYREVTREVIGGF